MSEANKNWKRKHLENKAMEAVEAPPEIQLARQHLIAYAILSYPQFQPAKHHILIANALEKVERGEIKRLMIFAPPRHGKSLLTSQLFPAWYLGRNPTNDLIFTSYGQDIADDCGRKTQGFINSEIHRLCFPNSKISTESNSVRRFHLESGSAYYSAGVGGPITGRGGHIRMIDDPYKNREDAESEHWNRILREWYTSTFYTRGQVALDSGSTEEETAPIVIILTRWTQNGIEQWLLDKAAEQLKDDPNALQWTILNLPALCEDEENDPLGRKEGEALWPSAFSAKTLEQIKRDIGSRDFNALYQQRPTSEEGDIFKREWWKFYDELPDDCEFQIQTWDTSYKDTNTADFVVGIVMAKRGSDIYLVDLFRRRLSFGGACNALREWAIKHPKATRKIVENKANGPAIISTMQNEIPGIIPLNPENNGSKEARWNASSGYVESGHIFLPRKAHWTGDFIEELAAVPNGQNDDQADAFAQGVLYLLGDRAAAIIEYYKRMVERNLQQAS